MFRRARPAAADAISAGTASDTAKGDKRSWASMRDRLRQRSADGRSFGEAHQADPHATPQAATGAAPAGAVAASPAATEGTISVPVTAAGSKTPPPASLGLERPSAAAVAPDPTRPGPVPSGQSLAFAQAVRRAVGEADATPDAKPAESKQPEREQPEPRQPGSTEARPMPAACTGHEQTNAAKPAGPNGHAAMLAASDADTVAKQVDPAPRPNDDPADALLGYVISVAGSVVWAMLEATGAMHAEIGAVVRLQASHKRSFGIITSLKSDGRRGADDDRRLVEIKLLGEMPDGIGRFRRGVSSHPALDTPIHMASRDELQAIFARPDKPTVRLGTLHQASDLPAYAITDNLLGKHFAILGTTGAGKSCSVTVILRAILDANPHGHIIMLDPHNEYAPAFGDRAELLNPGNLKLPYWLLNFEEIAEVLISKNSPERAYAESAILRSVILDARRAAVGPGVNADHITVDTPCPYRLSELIRGIKEAMGAFNKADSTAPYQHLIGRIESVTNDKRFDFMFSSFMVNDTMQHLLSRILRIPVNGKPVTIIDLSGVPSEIVDVVVSVLCRVVFEFALWSPRDKAPPILLVCEEAHRYVPRDDQAAFAPTKRSISRIAKEGRKYGLGLCLVTQRPSELSISSLSQCNTIFALRLGNENDLAFVRHAIPDSARWLTDAMPSLDTREAVVIGDGVPVPMHIRFDELDAAHRPASTTPAFSDAWQSDIADDGLIAETIERWRFQVRGARQGS